MKNKIISAKKFTLDIDKIYKNDFNLIKIIAQTKKMRHNNKTLEAHKNNLKELMTEINSEYILNNNTSRKNLSENNNNFHNEYELFNKRASKKETKVIFKDLIKLYKSKGYRIPNFSINTHNLFKINPLLEMDIDNISNGLLGNQIEKKNNDSEKVLQYLKKLGIILSEKMSTNDINLQKAIMKKFMLPKFKDVNNEEEIQILKKNIEIITNLINTNALSKLDDNKQKRYKNFSRQNSYVSMNYNSKKRTYILNKDKKKKTTRSRRSSLYNNNNRTLKIGTIKVNKNEFQDIRNSNDSSISSKSIKSNSNYINKKISNDKSSESLYKIFNFTNYANMNPSKIFPKTPKVLNIPIIKFQRNNNKKETEGSTMTFIDKNQILNLANNLSCKQNNVLNIKPINSNSFKSCNQVIFNYKSQKTPKSQFKINLASTKKNKNKRYPFFIKTQSNTESITNSNFSEELFFDSKSPRDINKNKCSINNRQKNDSNNNYPYTSKKEFINFAFNRFTKKNINDAEKYIKNYLNKVKGYDNEKVERIIKGIYNKNIKNNIKELEKQITDNDLYSKTERLYLNSHSIKRIKPLLNSMEERNKKIQRLEKILTDAVSSK